MKTIHCTLQPNPALVPYYQYGFGTFEESLTRPLGSQINYYGVYITLIEFRRCFVYENVEKFNFPQLRILVQCTARTFGWLERFSRTEISTTRIHYILVLLELARKYLYDIGCCGEKVHISMVVEHAHLGIVNVLIVECIS